MGIENKISRSTKSLTNFNEVTSITIRIINLDVYNGIWEDHGLARSMQLLMLHIIKYDPNPKMRYHENLQ